MHRLQEPLSKIGIRSIHFDVSFQAACKIVAAMPEATSPSPPRSFRRHFQNWLSWAGMVLAAAALFAFVFLFAIDFFAPIQNPYVGILAYVIAPFFLLLGLALTLLGANAAQTCGASDSAS